MIYSIWTVPALTFVFLICGLFLNIDHRKKLVLSLSVILLLIINGMTISLLFFSIALLNYLCGFLIRFNNRLMTFSLICINLSFLLSYKLMPFLNQESVLIPLGLSLFVFQQLSYVIDRENDPELKNLTFKDYFLYSFLFTNFFTGPVSRIKKIALQSSQFIFKKDSLNHGLLLIFCGIFQKLVIADNIAVLTRPMFNPGLKSYDFDVTLSFLLNKYEIFANFNGYSDIAIGSALILGIDLPVNFKRPFHVSSLSEFWKRWHMSLVSWIRDYVFYPLILSPLGKIGVPFSIMITFIIFGLWHDIKLTFFLYAILQVFIIFSEKYFSSILSKKLVPPFLKWCFFYVVLISVPGILFRADSIDQFFIIMNKLKQTSLHGFFNTLILYKTTLIPVVLGIVFYEWLSSQKPDVVVDFFQKKHFISRFVLITAVTICLLLIKSSLTGNGFIYATF